MKAENLYGQTFGKTSYKASTGEYPKGLDQSPELRYKSTIQENYVNQRDVYNQTAASIVGVDRKEDCYKKVCAFLGSFSPSWNSSSLT